MSQPSTESSPTPARPPRIEAGDTTLLKCVSVILIANSHLENLWPRSWMAADGLIGGELFFTIAGFGLVLSERFVRRPFLPWYWRRIVRMYPALLVVGVVTMIVNHSWRQWTLIDYPAQLIWPTDYTFVAQIMPYYILYFFIMKVRDARIYPALIILLSVPFAFVWYQDIHHDFPAHLSLGRRPLLISYIACFQMMLLGGWMAAGVSSVRPARLWEIAAMTAIFLSYVAAKYVMVVMGRGARFYPILHIQTFAIGYLVFRVSQSQPLLDFLRRKSPAAAMISLTAALTFEIYLVHYPVYESAFIQSLRFPVNLIVFALVTLVLSWLLSRLIAALRPVEARR